MGKPDNTGLLRVIRASRYSMQGLAQAWRYESAFRQEAVLAAILIPAAFWLGRSPKEIALLISVCLLVLVIELLNSAVEAAIDRHGDEFNTLSGRAKDYGSAAVMFALLITVATWIAVVYERFGNAGGVSL